MAGMDTGMTLAAAAILAAVDAAAIAAIFFGVVVLAALGVLALSGFRLWRAIQAARRVAESRLATLTAENARIQAALARLPNRQGELQVALASVQVRIRVAGMLAAYAGQAFKALRQPIKYLGG
jgi:hypothetical protein